jgi:hypothetical protein
MDDIKVDKAKLIKKLKKNRKAHRDEFLRAQARYREKVIELFDQRLREMRNGGKVKIYVDLPEPEDHTADFDTVISMMEWSQGKKVILSTREFQTYVENKWGWQQSFAANTQAYTSGKWSA